MEVLRASHDFDPVPRTFGVLFLGFSAAWALVADDVANLPALRAMIPLVLVCAGSPGSSARAGEP